MSLSYIKNLLEKAEDFAQVNAIATINDISDDLNQAGVNKNTKNVIWSHINNPKNMIRSTRFFDVCDMIGVEAAVVSLMFDGSSSAQILKPVIGQVIQNTYSTYEESNFYRENPKGMLFGVSSFNEKIRTIIPYMYSEVLNYYTEELYQLSGQANTAKAILCQTIEMLVQACHLASRGKCIQQLGVFVSTSDNNEPTKELSKTKQFLDDNLHYLEGSSIIYVATNPTALKNAKALGFVEGTSLLYIPQNNLNSSTFQ